jgi:hypothetical protein
MVHLYLMSHSRNSQSTGYQCCFILGRAGFKFQPGAPQFRLKIFVSFLNISK